MRFLKRFTAILLTALLLFGAAACAKNAPAGSDSEKSDASPAEKNGEVMILFTSDVHCGVEKGFGYVGLEQIRAEMEAQGYETLLVDDGDSIQGEALGTLTRGEAVIDLMNAMKYDVAIPGNHEFDYGAEHFFSLAEKAEFPYISCNLTKEGEPVFEPYVIKEAAGMKIAFVGVTTPETLTSSSPLLFRNEQGETVIDFRFDKTGEALYAAVQTAVDDARAEGADYVYVMGHLGSEATASPWTYADLIAHTSGFDVLLDGHSHDTEQVVMKNKDGKDVVRSACGTKLNCIGYSIVTPEDGVTETNVWSWTNDVSAPGLLGMRSGISAKIDEANAIIEEQLSEVIGQSAVELTINDPEAKDASGNPIRMVRRAETNLADFCTDAVLRQTGADIAVINGGGIRTDIAKGDVTYGEIIDVFPFGNQICVLEVTGQQILDALEWGARDIPDENGGFLHVAGMRYEIDVSVPDGCVEDEEGMCRGIEGERRVKNATVGDEPLDPAKTYKLAGADYVLLQNGGGQTAFDGAKVLQKDLMLDNEALIRYLKEDLNGQIGSEYADPFGQERIVITGQAE